MTARAWCDWFCARLHAAIARDAPAGLGRLDAAWEMVEVPSRALLTEIRKLEAGAGDKERAKALGMEVLAAWRRAGTKYAQG